MPEPRTHRLLHVCIEIPGGRFELAEHGGANGEAAALERNRSLAAQAMRWTYVLRTRERWAGRSDAQAQRERDATRTLAEFGLDDAALEQIAHAARAVVRIPFSSEADGWAARIMPWEYLIGSATRARRHASNLPLTVMRELTHAGTPRQWRSAHAAPRMLYVECAAGCRPHWDFDGERERVRHALGAAIDFEVLADPTPEQLMLAIGRSRPDLIHLTAFDNLVGLKSLRDNGNAQQKVRVDAAAPAVDVAEALADEARIPDGMLMSGADGSLEIVAAEQLARTLAGGGHCSHLISMSMDNSAARTAALAVGFGATLAAIGFQSTATPLQSNTFFELVYAQLADPAAPWNLPLAFERAWIRLREEPKHARASVVALWAGEPVLQRQPRRAAGAAPAATADGALASPPPQAARPTAAELPRRSDQPPSLVYMPELELNYAVLHNRGALFREFIVERGGAAETDWLDVDVALHLGSEPATFSTRFRATRDRFDLRDAIHLPLTAQLMRSVRESVISTLSVQLSHNGVALDRSTHRLKLLPVDQWRDNDRDGQWLPSFVLPRDAAVLKVVEQAQAFVRVLRDDPNAGFEGYQVAPDPKDASQLEQVDLQVQAIWSTLLHEWRLGYVNPPPGYSRDLDSQRLRTPSTVCRNRSGTCIDLALLFAACLELVDIYPVIFLRDDHAFPGYWRHHRFQADFQALRDPGAAAPNDRAQRDTLRTGRQQQYSWQAIGQGAWRELHALVNSGQLVPLETVALTSHGSFGTARAAGKDWLEQPQGFHSMLDIVAARTDGITPLPIAGDAL